jgi:hypothetical protein
MPPKVDLSRDFVFPLGNLRIPIAGYRKWGRRQAPDASLGKYFQRACEIGATEPPPGLSYLVGRNVFSESLFSEETDERAEAIAAESRRVLSLEFKEPAPAYLGHEIASLH